MLWGQKMTEEDACGIIGLEMLFAVFFAGIIIGIKL